MTCKQDKSDKCCEQLKDRLTKNYTNKCITDITYNDIIFYSFKCIVLIKVNLKFMNSKF